MASFHEVFSKSIRGRSSKLNSRQNINTGPRYGRWV